MSRLDKDREKIDEIDAQIAKLFEERFETVRDVIDYKIENRLPILNSDRENGCSWHGDFCRCTC